MSLRPTQAEVLAALRMAVTVDRERGPFGGVPVLLRWDRRLEFAADSIAQATLALGCVSRRTDAYCPWQKGKIERLNRTIEQELLQGLPGWTGGPRDVRGRLVDQTPWTLEGFVAVFADWINHYNTCRPHTVLAGRTPLEVWRSDATPVRALEHQEARWLLLARTSHVVQKDGIQYLRHLHHHPRTKFSLLLVGGDGCWRVLSREPMLRSRIYRRVRFAPMRLQTVLEVIPGYHRIDQNAPGELIAMVDDRYAHGCFREWASFTHSALALSHEQNATVLTESVARAVLELHAGGELGEAG